MFFHWVTRDTSIVFMKRGKSRECKVAWDAQDWRHKCTYERGVYNETYDSMMGLGGAKFVFGFRYPCVCLVNYYVCIHTNKVQDIITRLHNYMNFSYFSRDSFAFYF